MFENCSIVFAQLSVKLTGIYDEVRRAKWFGMAVGRVVSLWKKRLGGNLLTSKWVIPLVSKFDVVAIFVLVFELLVLAVDRL